LNALRVIIETVSVWCADLWHMLDPSELSHGVDAAQTGGARRNCVG
jgi:hypothetical protein